MEKADDPELELYKEIGALPSNQQRLISALSSHLLERDVHESFATDPLKYQALKKLLISRGFDEKGLVLAMRVFGLEEISAEPPDRPNLP
ncbi:hypothetical protein HYS91_04085 [Candidatus Daviesbacteria bacterium]|nr:hypothetical protein [Candidatus Daviesbacteria bacterium]